MSERSHPDRLRSLLDAVVDADTTDAPEMARSSFASEFHFSREVRRLTGESPAALRRRIDEMIVSYTACSLGGGTRLLPSVQRLVFRALDVGQAVALDEFP